MITPVAEPTRAAPSVVVVDDDASMRDAIRELLEELGFAVVGLAGDGSTAVAVVADARPDVVLMDVRMPKMDGLEATRQIRVMRPAVQVVLLSAYDDLTFRRAAEEVGACSFLAKGCSPDMLERTLRAAAAKGPG